MVGLRKRGTTQQPRLLLLIYSILTPLNQTGAVLSG